jgi:hypothetical protein
MPCYKKHQQRASCSGKRDPSAYLKKSQLATPTGLDQDYNYLRDVERAIEHAGQDVCDRGVGAQIATHKGVARTWRPEGKLQDYLTANQITMERAPVGMSRHKVNATRVTKSDFVMWTVEWASAKGVLGIQRDCLESSSLVDLFAQFNKAKSDDHEPQSQRAKKRRRVQESVDPLANGQHTDVIGSDAERISTSKAAQPVNSTQLTQPVEQRTEDALQEHHETVTGVRGGSSNATMHARHDPAPCFYLLKPATASNSKVLIPVNPEDTLTQCLNGQTVQEYPTFYALNEGPHALPADFITEEEYNRLRKAEDAELKSLVQGAGVRKDVQEPPGPDPSEELDSQSILDMLKRDVRRAAP